MYKIYGDTCFHLLVLKQNNEKKRFSQNPNFSHILCSVLQCLSQTAKAITPPNYHRALQLSRRKIKWQAIFIQIKQEM